jgi:murein DD-endopeptidase MepM/ murein hydrolase activator NlpD
MGMSLRDRSLVLGALLAQLYALPVSANAGHTAALTSDALRSTRASLANEQTEWAARVRLDATGRPAYLARFSDGPRRVPRARGAAKKRADELKIGSADQARRLLRSRPEPELLRAVRGSAPRDLLWPVVQGHFGRGFGFTRRVRTELPHNGVDIGAPEGTLVRAAADGLVVYSDNGLLGFGNCVMLLHKNGWLSLYAHQQRTTVQAGYFVKRGERIGLVGHTGYAWGPHLHFELRDNARLRDPERLFTGRKSDEVNGTLVPLSAAGAAVPATATAHARGAGFSAPRQPAPSAKRPRAGAELGMLRRPAR